MRPLALALAGMLALVAAQSRAADPAPPSARRPPAGAVREPGPEDEPDAGEGPDDVEPGDDGLDEGRALPSEPPPLRAPLRPVPRGQEEEAPPPGEQPPTQFGPAEPASAAQPLAPG